MKNKIAIILIVLAGLILSFYSADFILIRTNDEKIDSLEQTVQTLTDSLEVLNNGSK